MFLLRYQLASLMKDCGWKVPEIKDLLVGFDMEKGRKKPQLPEREMPREEWEAMRKRQVAQDKQFWAAALHIVVGD